MAAVQRPAMSRRSLLRAGAAAVLAAIVAACTNGKKSASPTPTGTQPAPTTPSTGAPATLVPTPACTDGDETTPEQTEGPFFTRNSPERANIRSGVNGTALVVAGTVVTTACKPVAKALLEFWQADDGGAYDNSGFKLRGHQFADAQGRYSLETIVPGLYTGRTRHIHVKVQAPGGKVLTSQLYFPGEPQNGSDGIYQKELEMAVRSGNAGKTATFTFVLQV